MTTAQPVKPSKVAHTLLQSIVQAQGARYQELENLTCRLHLEMVANHNLSLEYTQLAEASMRLVFACRLAGVKLTEVDQLSKILDLDLGA